MMIVFPPDAPAPERLIVDVSTAVDVTGKSTTELSSSATERHQCYLHALSTTVTLSLTSSSSSRVFLRHTSDH